MATISLQPALVGEAQSDKNSNVSPSHTAWKSDMLAFLLQTLKSFHVHYIRLLAEDWKQCDLQAYYKQTYDVIYPVVSGVEEVIAAEVCNAK